jgi:glycosyltransferase involved in cell wall biosynthesis
VKILFVCYYFPPDSSSGSFRPFFFANHLAEANVEVHVLTAKVEDFLQDQMLDLKLYENLHPEVSVTRCTVRRPLEFLLRLRDRFIGRDKGESPIAQTKAVSLWNQIKDLITDLLSTPDRHIGWVPDCVRQGKKIIGVHKPDLIFATGSPWSSLLAGMFLKKATGIPLVLDFRDPWTSNPSFNRRSKLIRWMDEYLERRVVLYADGIIANTQALREDMLTKFPLVSAGRITTVTNGFEAYMPVLVQPAGKPLTITHTGAIYYSRDPAPFLAAVKHLVKIGTIAPADIRLKFVGGIEIAGTNVSNLLISEELCEVVKLIPRVPFDEAQLFAQEADILLLLQPEFPLQVPRKLYEYMAIRKPVLCIAEPDSATGRLVSEHGLGMVCNNTIDEIAASLKNYIELWRKGDVKPFDDNRSEKFNNIALCRQLQEFMAGLLISDNKLQK